jgi:gliding motility-associated-like protein
VFVHDGEATPATAGNDISWCTPTNSAVLVANDPTFPATGLWTSLSGTGTLAEPTDPNTAVFGLGVGQHDFLWTIDNGACGSTSDTISVFIFDGESEAANAGPDQELCTPNTSTSLAGNAVVFPATGSWTVISGTGTFADANDPATTVSGLSIGANVFRWTIINGPCGDTEDDVVITLFDEDQPAANAGGDQQICTPTNSVTLQGSVVTFPAVGTWVFVSGTGTLSDPNSPTATLSGLGVGSVTLQWQVDNGPCGAVTTDEVTINVFDNGGAVALAGPDQDFCSPVTGTVTMFASSPVAPGVGQWTLLSGSGTIADPTNPFTVITGLGIGENRFQWTIDNGPCGSTSDEVSLTVYNSTVPPANAGPDQEFCQDIRSTQLNAEAVFSTATGVWSVLDPSGGNAIVSQPNDPESDVEGFQLIQLPTTEYAFIWSVTNGPFPVGSPCGPTADTMMVRIKDCVTVKVPDAFSPNGDGVNDVLVITNIETYPNNRITIFNRWGSKVYEASPYRNQWDGTSQFGAMYGETLPESTYYYVLDLGDGSDARTGFIYLRR